MRYIVLVLLNVPIILLALMNLLTQYKLGRISKGRFRHQILLWVVILVVLIGSFPIYNQLSGKAPLDSSQLSLFDIFESTAIIYLIYIINNHRRKIEYNERLIRDLHQEISIKLAASESSKK